MRHSIILLLILFMLPIMAKAQNTCHITYIANEGFLVETGGKKVIIDGLFGQIDGDWCDSPNKQTIALMEAGSPPFDQIDLLAITHKHQDHFNAQIVVKHLLNNSGGMVVCPNQVVEILMKDPDYERIKDRIVSITPRNLGDSILEVSGIPLRVMRLEHSHYMEEDSTGKMRNRHQDIENLGYLFHMGGVKIFHCGDTNPLNKEEYSGYALQNDSIDVAFLERMFVARGAEGMEIINQFIQPRHIVFMHIGPQNRDAFTEHFREIEHVTIFQEKMDSIQID